MNNLHKLDTTDSVFFYEQEFYGLSNFSAFNLVWKDLVFPTSEHAYQWEKFDSVLFPKIKASIYLASSAHEAFKLAEVHKENRFLNWDDIKVPIMKNILRAKVSQHEYVIRKLLETGNRKLIEDSWRDPYWGWGADKQGTNMLGTLWMEIREELVK